MAAKKTTKKTAKKPTVQQSNATFHLRLYGLLEDAARDGHDDIISWNVDGTAFEIHDVAKFEKKILPKYFNTNKVRSFQRQLSFYGFQRIEFGIHAFVHPWFLRGDLERCKDATQAQMREARRGDDSQPAEECETTGTTNSRRKKQAKTATRKASKKTEKAKPVAKGPSPQKKAAKKTGKIDSQPKTAAKKAGKSESQPSKAATKKTGKSSTKQKKAVKAGKSSPKRKKTTPKAPPRSRVKKTKGATRAATTDLCVQDDFPRRVSVLFDTEVKTAIPDNLLSIDEAEAVGVISDDLLSLDETEEIDESSPDDDLFSLDEEDDMPFLSCQQPKLTFLGRQESFILDGDEASSFGKNFYFTSYLFMDIQN